jgi:hypothetical protein
LETTAAGAGSLRVPQALAGAAYLIAHEAGAAVSRRMAVALWPLCFAAQEVRSNRLALRVAQRKIIQRLREAR